MRIKRFHIEHLPKEYNFAVVAESPINEECAQFGTEGYHERAIKECTAMIHQLERVHGDPPSGSLFFIINAYHDLPAKTDKNGRIILPIPYDDYHEVAVMYPNNDEEGEKFALKCENEIPEYWDDEARKELGLKHAAEIVHLEEDGKSVCGRPGGKLTGKRKELTCKSCIEIVA